MNQYFEPNLPDNAGPICVAYAESDGDHRSILLVEDESFVREVTCEILTSAGYGVFAAKNAIEATRIYEEVQSQVDLVITDLILPGETGRSLAARLQRQNRLLKVLYMSGYQNQIEFKQGLKKDFLMKPFSGYMLLNRVRLMLDCPTLGVAPDEMLTQACDGELPG